MLKPNSITSEEVETKTERFITHYIVQHPVPFLKIWETDIPMSFQSTELLPSELLVVVACRPKSLSKHDTKSDGVIPSFFWALTDYTKLLVISSKASASDTCSGGFWTYNDNKYSTLIFIVFQDSKPLY